MTPEQLNAIMPHMGLDKAKFYQPIVDKALGDGGLDTPQRQAAFLAQIAHETTELRHLTELWGPTPAQVGYDGRKDLGNNQPGDGFRYRGRGVLMITGRYMYGVVGKALGLDLVGNPDQASSLDVALKIGIYFWNSHHLNDYADKDNEGDFVTITKRINGGLNGEPERLAYWVRARHVLGLK